MSGPTGSKCVGRIRPPASGPTPTSCSGGSPRPPTTSRTSRWPSATRSSAGGSSRREQFLGLVRPAEFTADHQPAFVQGKEPKKFLCLYPFVRTAEWYLIDPKERGRMLRDHGELGRQFPDVWANTTSAFGLGDWEWILAFEADTPDRLVDLIRTLRGTEARRYTKVEIPFFTGIRKDVAGVVQDLP